MKTAILILSASVFVTALVLGIIARKCRTEGSPPIPSLNPVHWVQPWKVSEWLTPKGAKFFWLSYICFILGVALYIIAEGFPPLFD